ncbi:hypothetical protein Syun_023346 [Stephania yunnanensis]|uniref:Uncharacterized protein n=1 Tax=Stephania yunnanensis TaxID=152371 RepID=A0AAP0F8S3_9MAGN
MLGVVYILRGMWEPRLLGILHIESYLRSNWSGLVIVHSRIEQPTSSRGFLTGLNLLSGEEHGFAALEEAVPERKPEISGSNTYDALEKTPRALNSMIHEYLLKYPKITPVGHYTGNYNGLRLM